MAKRGAIGPPLHFGPSSALKAYGYRGRGNTHVRGVRCRPVFPMQDSVCHLIRCVLRAGGYGPELKRPFEVSFGDLLGELGAPPVGLHDV